MAKIELTKEQTLLYNELKKLSKTANQRILTLERSFKDEPLATKYLREKLQVEPLQAWSKKGRVRVSKKMTAEQMKATIKATKDYLKNPMSTRRGIKKARSKAIETIKDRYNVDVVEGAMSEDELDSLANFFEDDEVNDITNYIDGSPTITIVGDYIEKESKAKSYGDFYSDMINHQQYHVRGDDVRPIPVDLLRRIYVKYIYKMHDPDNLDTSVDSMYDLEGKTETELDELLQNVEQDYKNGAIDEKEYYYLSDKIVAKWRELIEGKG